MTTEAMTRSILLHIADTKTIHNLHTLLWSSVYNKNHFRHTTAIKEATTRMSSSTTTNLLKVSNAGVKVLNGDYHAKEISEIPVAFDKTCQEMGWNTLKMWTQLAVPEAPWFLHEQNGSYVYLHKDGRWWMDDPSGGGIYVCRHQNSGNVTKVPSSGWEALQSPAARVEPMPTVEHVINGI